MSKNRDLFIYLLKAAYIFIVTFLLYWALSHRVYDDPFITYRYAENLRNGLGFVYNPGEYILSTTTPLFAVLLALLKGGWPGALPQLANLAGAFSVALGGLILWDLGQTWKTPFVAWSGLLLYPTFPLLLLTLGSETPLFLTLVLGTFALYARERYGFAVFLLTLAILTRSDAVLVGALLGGHYLWKSRDQLRQKDFWRQQPWLWIGISLGLLLVWHGFAWWYFGSPLPITLAAKQAQGRMAISQGFAPGFLQVAGWYSGGWQYWVELGLVALGTIFTLLKKPRWLLILSWIALYFLAYTLLGVTRYFWYYAPLVPGWIVAIGLGLEFLYRLSLTEKGINTPMGKKIWRGIIVFVLSALFMAQLFHVSKMYSTNDVRYPIYRAVGEWLGENIPEDASVGALEIGMIGYFSNRPMVDFAGLIQPEVADQMQSETTYDDTAVWATLTYQPQYLALISDAHPRLETEVIAEYCQLVKQFKGSQYNYSDMQIYYCQYD